jgi:hypothetical protein
VKKTRKPRRRVILPRALAVWIETPVRTTWDETGRPIRIYEPGYCVWIDENWGFHSVPLIQRRGRQIAPKFKMFPPGPGLAIELGKRPGDFTIVSRPR